MKLVRILTVLLLVVTGPAAFSQQLMLGKNPFVMNKSAVLELNADNQGLLLPRITDTALINALTPPDGMVIFFVPVKQILIRTNGYWRALSLSGNYITALSGDVTAAGPGSAAATVTGLRGASLPALSPGFLKYNGTSWVFDNSTYLTANQSITWSGGGDVSGTATGSIFLSPSITVNGLKGAALPPLSPGFLKYNGTSWAFDNSTYLTGNQTVSLSGDVTGSGTTAIPSTISNGAVTYAKMQNTAMTSGLLGRYAGTAGSLQEITLGTGLTLNSTTGVLSTVNNGTVTAVSVASANGFAGTVATSTSTPSITLSTTVTGMLKGNGTALAAATAGTDYLAPNTAITGATKTKITYDSKGLVTAGANATTDDIIEGTNLYYTNARARNALSAGTGISYNTATGVIASTGNQTITWTAGGDISGTASGTTSLSPSLTVSGLGGKALPALASGFLKYNGTSWAFDNNTYLTGSAGTVNYLPKFTAAGTTLGNSQVFDNGTNVGIGTATPAQKLDVSGNLAFSGALMPGNSAGTSGYILQSTGNNSAPAWVDPSSLSNLNAWTTGGNNFSGTAVKQLGSITSNPIVFITNNAERMRLMDGTGYLGVNTNAPGNFLEVKGALASTVSGLRLNGLGTVTPAAANGKVLSVNSSGDVIVTDPPASTGYIQNQVATNQAADMRISGRALIGGPATDNGMTLDVNGSVAMRVASLSLNMGSNNNIVLTNNAFFRITGPTGDFEINSIAGGTDGRMIILYNATTYNMTIKDEGTGTAGNTIYCPDTGATPAGAADIVVKKRGSATLIYSAADAHWIIVSTR